MAKKKKIIKKTPTRVHSFRCTDTDWKELKKLAKECGMSIGKYLVETGKKHHPRQRLTPEESKALNLSLIHISFLRWLAHGMSHLEATASPLTLVFVIILTPTRGRSRTRCV